MEKLKGLRIKIEKAVGMPFNENYVMNDPRPEHTEKLGWIVKDEDENGNLISPYIQLDDGTELRGYECWWSLVK